MTTRYSLSIYLDTENGGRTLLADSPCTLSDWQDLRGADEDPLPLPRVRIYLESTVGAACKPPIDLSLATARVLLPDLVATFIRRQLEAHHG